MRITLLVFIAALSSAAWAAVEPTPEDYAVWEAVLKHASADKAGTIYVWEKIDRFEVYDYRAMKGFPASMKLLTKELIAAFNRRNWDRRDAATLQASFGRLQQVKLFGEQTMTEQFGRVLDPGWRINPRVFGDASLVTKLSFPAYSRDGRRAFVFAALYRPQRGDESYFILRRERDGGWRVAEDKAWWSWDEPNYTSDR